MIKMRHPRRGSPATAVAVVLVGVALFGLSPILLLISGASGLVGGTYRVAIPLIPYGILAALTGSLGAPIREIRWALGAGIAFGLNIGLFYSAVTMAGPSVPSFLSTTAILWAGLFWMLRKRRKLPVGFWIGSALCVAGLAQLTTLFRTQPHSPKGIALALAAGFVYAMFILLNGLGSRRLRLEQFLFYSHLSATVSLLLLGAVFDNSLTGYNIQAYTALFAIGAISQTVGFCAITAGQRHLSTPSASALLTSEPLFTMIFSILFLDESITLGRALGGLILLTGSFVAALSVPGLSRQPRVE